MENAFQKLLPHWKNNAIAEKNLIGNPGASRVENPVASPVESHVARAVENPVVRVVESHVASHVERAGVKF